MGRKSAAKAKQTSTGAPPPDQPRAKTPVVAAALIMVALAVGVFTYFNQSAPSEPAASSAANQLAERPLPADLKAHPQENLPALNFPAYATARPPEVIK